MGICSEGLLIAVCPMWKEGNMKKLNVVAIGLCLVILVVAGVPSTGFSYFEVECQTAGVIAVECGACPTGWKFLGYVIPFVQCSNLLVNGNCCLPGQANCTEFGNTVAKCSSGTPTEPAPNCTTDAYQWQCIGLNGGATANCSHPITAKCGIANGETLCTSPADWSLCGSCSTASPVTGSGPWNWTCSLGTSSVSCQSNFSCADCLCSILPIVRGKVAADGTIISGTGFTVAHVSGSGTYNITFDVPYPDPPVCFIQLANTPYVNSLPLTELDAIIAYGTNGSPDTTTTGFTVLTFEPIGYYFTPYCSGPPCPPNQYVNSDSYQYEDNRFNFFCMSP